MLEDLSRNDKTNASIPEYEVFMNNSKEKLIISENDTVITIINIETHFLQQLPRKLYTVQNSDALYISNLNPKP